MPLAKRQNYMFWLAVIPFLPSLTDPDVRIIQVNKSNLKSGHLVWFFLVKNVSFTDISLCKLFEKASFTLPRKMSVLEFGANVCWMSILKLTLQQSFLHTNLHTWSQFKSKAAVQLFKLKDDRVPFLLFEKCIRTSTRSMLSFFSILYWGTHNIKNIYISEQPSNNVTRFDHLFVNHISKIKWETKKKTKTIQSIHEESI